MVPDTDQLLATVQVAVSLDDPSELAESVPLEVVVSWVVLMATIDEVQVLNAPGMVTVPPPESS